MRLATFNLFSGRPQDQDTTDPELLATSMKDLDADVAGLQEVDRGQPRSGGVDQAALAAETVGAEHWRFVPALVGTPGSEWRAAGPGDEEVDGRGGHAPAMYGVALLSRYPVREWHVLRLPRVPGRAPVRITDSSGRRKTLLVEDEPRAAVAAVLETPAGPLTAATTHLSFVPLWNVWQLLRLSRWMRELPGPHVILGDLNIPGGLPRLVSREWHQLVTGATWPAGRPRVQLDHILGRGTLPRVRDTSVPHLPLSDHRALVVDLAD